MAKDSKNNEPVMLVRPAIRSLGLDYLHVSLIILVVILVGLAFALSSFKPGSSALNCPYGINTNSTCVTPIHTNAQALSAAKQVLASYSTLNTSLNLLPYYAEINLANASYLSNQSEWLVVIPEVNPLTNNTRYYVSFLLHDSNLSLASSFIQTINPLSISDNRVAAYGAVQIFGKTSCIFNATKPMPVYAFVDPYAPGALEGLEQGINASETYGNKINVSYKFIFTGYAIKLYNSFGVNGTQQNAEDLWCASLQQDKFKAYVANYSILFNGEPLGAGELQQVAQGSGLNLSEFTSCVNNSAQPLDNQAVFANYYDISATPTFVVDCAYQTIPETLNAAIGYALSQNSG